MFQYDKEIISISKIISTFDIYPPPKTKYNCFQNKGKEFIMYVLHVLIKNISWRMQGSTKIILTSARTDIQ